MVFKDINVYSLTCGMLFMVLGGYLQTHNNSPTVAFMVSLCFALALYLVINPIIESRNRFQRKATDFNALFKENEGLYNAIVRNTTDAIFTLNEEGTIETFNPAAEVLFGYDAWEVIGKSVLPLISAEYSHYIENKTSTKSPREAEAVRKDGTYFPVQLSVNKANINGSILLVCILRDVTASKNVQQELQKALDFQEMIINSIPDFLFVKDTNFNVVIANNAFLNLFPGDAGKNLIGSKTIDHCEEYQALEILRRDKDAFDSGYSEAEETLSLPNGQTRILSTKKVRFYGWDNEPFILGFARDITELKEKERQVKESEQRLALAIEGGGLGFWDWNITTGKITFSEGWAEMLGYYLEELEQSYDTWKSLIHPDDLHSAIENIENYLAGKIPEYETEFRMQHKDGSWHYILSRGKVFEFDATGNPVRAVGTHLDITDRLKQQGRLNFLKNVIVQSNETNTQEEFLLSILQVICKYIHWPMGHAYIWNPEQEYFQSSGCWYIEDHSQDLSEFRDVTEKITFSIDEGVLGHIAKTGMPQWSDNIIHDERFLRNKYLDHINLQSAFAFPLYVHSRVCIILEFFSPNIVEEDNELFLIWETISAQLSRAIEKHKTAEEREIYMRELETAKEEAQRANIMKSEFLTNMSHEIRTPLNGIIGGTDLLKRTKITEDQRKYLNLIYNSGDTLLAIINDVLDLSKIEAGELEIKPEPVNIRSLVQDTMQAISPKAEGKDIELVINITEKVPFSVMADEIRLKQIMINLLGNAVKFVEKGYIAATVKVEELVDNNITLHFGVKDTGIGIPENKLETIFDKFAQVDATTTKKYGGTGLGLAITQRLVEMMNGEIGVNSVVDEGTEFWFHITVPIIEQHETTAPAHETKLDENLKVLIVDDMDVSREFLSTALTEMQVTHKTAPDAQTGLDLLEQAYEQNAPYDIVLVDYFMPDTNGRDMADKIRNSEKTKNTKIVLMSALSKLEAAGLNPEKWEEAVFDSHLVKPINNKQLKLKLIEMSSSANTKKPDNSSSSEPKTNSEIKMDARILLVENEMVNQMVATDMLENLGCTVEVAENGQEAVDMLSDNNDAYDVVLMDCMMPVMDGFEATQEIRDREKEKGLSHQTIIAMTANAMTGEKEKCIAVGMDDYLAKPVKETDLYAKLREYIA